MVLLHSEKIPLGSAAVEFNLPSADGKVYSLGDFQSSKLLLVMFICNHCPYVQAVEDRFIQLQRDYAAKGLGMAGICSNDPTDYPDDLPKNLLKRWKEKDYRFPYLIDESQEVAKSYGAVCTPEFYLFDSDRNLAYHGQLDDNWKDPSKVTHHTLREVIEKLLAGGKAPESQTPSMGCSIKWKK